VTDENRNAIIQAGGLVTAQSIIKAASSQDGDTRVHKQALKLLTNLAYAGKTIAGYAYFSLLVAQRTTMCKLRLPRARVLCLIS